MGVLIVDDDDSIRDTFTQILEDEGYYVSSATNGLEAITQLRSNSDLPCLILLDLSRPIMNGWEFRNEQQQDPTLALVPVVVLSADRSVQQKATTINANGYLQKPVDIITLLDTVERFCSR